MIGTPASFFQNRKVAAWEAMAGLGSVWINLWAGNGHDLYGNADLSAQAAALANQATVGLQPGPTNQVSHQAQEFGDGTNDAFEAATVAIAQPAAGRDRIWLAVFKPTVVGGVRDVFGWRDDGPDFRGSDVQLLGTLTWSGRYDWGGADLPWTHGGVLALNSWYVATLFDRQSTNELIFGTSAAGGAALVKGVTGGVGNSTTRPFASGEARTQAYGGQNTVMAFGDVTGLGLGTADIDTLNANVAAGMIV